MLTKALAEKQASKEPKPDYIDLDGDGDKKEPMSQAAKDKKSKGIQAMIDAGNKKADAEANEDQEVAEYDVPSNFENKHKDINNLGRKMMDMSSNMSGTDDTSLMMANALSRLGEVLAEFGGSGFAANNMNDVIKKSSLNKEIVQMLMKKAKEED
jgi:predicted RND superfamily exporter protein